MMIKLPTTAKERLPVVFSDEVRPKTAENKRGLKIIFDAIDEINNGSIETVGCIVKKD